MKRDSQQQEVMIHLYAVPGRTLAFVAESVGVLKDVQTSYTNQPKAKVFPWNCFVSVGRFRKLVVDVEHKEAEGVSSFACRGCVRWLELRERKVDEIRAGFLNATDRIAHST